MKKEGKVTTDDLARMVQNGFKETREYVDKRFNELGDDIDQRFLALDNTINYRFDQIEKVVLEDHRRRIEKLEQQVGELQGKVGLRK